MKEYRVEYNKLKDLQMQLNAFAMSGWQVCSIIPYQSLSAQAVVVYEREVGDQEPAEKSR